MEWIIACDQPFDEVEKPEFVAMMNHAHHGRGPLNMPKCEGMKRRAMKMGEDTVGGIHMFAVRHLCVDLFR